MFAVCLQLPSPLCPDTVAAGSEVCHTTTKWRRHAGMLGNIHHVDENSISLVVLHTTVLKTHENGRRLSSVSIIIGPNSDS